MPDARLPDPAPQDLSRSRELARRMHDAIATAGGWLGFDAWMALALQAPGLGYYASPGAKFGGAGDFVTAPGLGPLFGHCVATQLAQWMDAGLPARVLEFGAGDGSLAADVLQALAGQGVLVDEYAILELSGDLRARQADTLARRVPALAARVRWLDALPRVFEGCVLANEVLDAMPVRLFRATDGQVLERGVASAGEGFAFADRPADAAFAQAVGAVLDATCTGWREQGAAFDYVSEWHEQAAAWTRELAARIAPRGAVLLVDYGFARAEYYHLQRRGGTLMAHRAHHAQPDPFPLPGLQDITAHVEFSAVMEAASDAGLELAGYTTQANFLLNCGLPAHFAALQPADAMGRAQFAQAVQKLVSEAEMGELFKAIAFTRGLDAPAVGFARGDRSGRL